MSFISTVTIAHKNNFTKTFAQEQLHWNNCTRHCTRSYISIVQTNIKATAKLWDYSFKRLVVELGEMVCLPPATSNNPITATSNNPVFATSNNPIHSKHQLGFHWEVGEEKFIQTFKRQIGWERKKNKKQKRFRLVPIQHHFSPFF